MTTASESRLRLHLTKPLFLLPYCTTVSLGHFTIGTSQSSINSIFADPLDCAYQLAQPDPEHVFPWALSGQWYRILLDCSSISQDCHVIHMDDYWIPKQIFNGQLSQGSQSCGGQFKRYKDTLKSNLKSCGIPFAKLESCALGRSTWAHHLPRSHKYVRSNWLDQLKEKLQKRKLQPTAAAAAGFICNICRCMHGLRIGLFAYRRTHCWWDSLYQRLSPYMVWLIACIEALRDLPQFVTNKIELDTLPLG